MAMAVLRQRDCATQLPFASDVAMDALRFVPLSKRTCGQRQNFSPNSCRRRCSSSNEKSAGKNRTVAVTKPDVKEDKELVMGKVRILKRGENLSPNLSPSQSEGSRSVRFEKEEDLIMCSTDRLGSDSDVVREQMSVCEKTMTLIVEDRFAGSVSTPPPPSSVPIPMWRGEERRGLEGEWAAPEFHKRMDFGA